MAKLSFKRPNGKYTSRQLWASDEWLAKLWLLISQYGHERSGFLSDHERVRDAVAEINSHLRARPVVPDTQEQELQRLRAHIQEAADDAETDCTRITWSDVRNWHLAALKEHKHVVLVPIEKWQALYQTSNEVAVYAGAHGEISNGDRIGAMLDALRAIDGGTYSEEIGGKHAD